MATHHLAHYQAILNQASDTVAVTAPSLHDKKSDLSLSQYAATGQSGPLSVIEPKWVAGVTSYLLTVGLFSHKLAHLVRQDNRVYKAAIFVGIGAIPAACILRMITLQATSSTMNGPKLIKSSVA